MRWTQAVVLAGLTSLAQAKSYNNVRDQEIRDCGSVGCYAKAQQARAVVAPLRKIMARQNNETTTATTEEPVTTEEPTTTVAPEPTSTGSTTISVVYPTPTDYAVIFSLPAGSAIITEIDGVEIVLKNNGCFGAIQGENPFTGRTDETTDGSASGCTGFCFGGDLKLSSNIQGTCYCGTENPGLTPISASYCQEACPGNPGEFCGSNDVPVKRSVTKRAPGTVAAQVLEAISRADVVIPGVDTTTTTTGTEEPVTTGTEEPVTTGTEEPVTTGTEEPTATGTDTTTGTERPTTTTSRGTVPTGVPLIFGVSRVGGGQPSNAVKRQTNTGTFIGGAGPVAPSNCDRCQIGRAHV